MRRRLVVAVVLMVLAVVTGGTRFIVPVAAQDEPVTVVLGERNESGVSGEAVIESADGAVWVRVTVEDTDQTYLPYLHRGTCEEYLNAPAIPLALVMPGEPSETAVDLTIEELLSGGYVIDLHVIDGGLEELLDPETSVACGPIGDPASDQVLEGAASVTEQPPDTGIGPIQSGRDWTLAAALAMAIASLVLALTCLRERPQMVEAPVVISVVAMHRLRGLTQ